MVGDGRPGERKRLAQITDTDLAVHSRSDHRQQPQPDRITERLEHPGQFPGRLRIERPLSDSSHSLPRNSITSRLTPGQPAAYRHTTGWAVASLSPSAGLTAIRPSSPLAAGHRTTAHSRPATHLAKTPGHDYGTGVPPGDPPTVGHRRPHRLRPGDPRPRRRRPHDTGPSPCTPLPRTPGALPHQGRPGTPYVPPARNRSGGLGSAGPVPPGAPDRARRPLTRIAHRSAGYLPPSAADVARHGTARALDRLA